MRCLVLLAAILLPACTAWAECIQQRVALLPLTLWDQKIYVGAFINGTPLTFFVDTGAALTTLSQAAADTLNLPRDFDHASDTFGIGGAESHLTLVGPADISLDALTLHHARFPVAAFGQRLADGSAVGGLIGADILSRFDLDLDIPGRRLGLWRVSGCIEITPDWSGPSSSVAIDIAPSRHVSVPVRVDDSALDLLLDTGSPSLVLSTRAAARAGATPEVLEENRRLRGSGVNDRPFEAWLHIFRHMDIGGHAFGDVRAVVVSPGRLQTEDGLLGLEYLKRGRVWISYGTSRLYLQAVPQ